MLKRPLITRPIEDVVADILDLDLGPIRFTLVRRGWTGGLADRFITEYRRLLELMVRFPDDVIVPSEDVDTVWHTHILDTARYRDDCMRIFGFFLDHFPYLGTRGSDDEDELRRLYTRSRELYEQTFGHRTVSTASACSAFGAGNGDVPVPALVGAATVAYCGGGGGKPSSAPSYHQGGSCG